MEHDYIREALKRYDMQDAEFQMIRHNENMTVKVDEKYLLRIHKHAEGFHTDDQYEGLDCVEIRRSELAFLSHLNSQGMKTQLPVPNKDGDLLTVLPDGVCATMLTWIPGRNLEKSDLTPDICFQIGVMTAQMHKAAVNFKSKEMLKYDVRFCERMEKSLESENAIKILGKANIQVMQAACSVIRDKLSRSRNMITVHADLSLSNILLTDSGLIPIDFSLFGIAHPMMDISGLYCVISDFESRCAIAKGYESLGGKIDFQMLDVYFVLNILLFILLHINQSSRQNDLVENVERWCRDMFQPLANGEPLVPR